MSHFNLRIGLFASAVAAALMASPASATDSPTVAVGYGDLDLGSPSGIAALNRRIESAARRLCEGHRSTLGPWGIVMYRNCFNGALASAQTQVSLAVARASGVQLANRPAIDVSRR